MDLRTALTSPIRPCRFVMGSMGTTTSVQSIGSRKMLLVRHSMCNATRISHRIYGADLEDCWHREQLLNESRVAKSPSKRDPGP
jgi:hypothetical protein